MSLRIFISSTYTDLKDVRESVALFIAACGYEPVTFEKNDVPYEPHKLLEESCYEEIASCSMMVLLLRSRFGAASSRRQGKTVVSVTQREYQRAKSLGLPIFVFVHDRTMVEYEAYKKQGMPSSFTFSIIEDPSLARFIGELYEDASHRYIHKFSNIDDISSALRKQWTGLFRKYLEDQRKYFERQRTMRRINPYKFFYFRKNSGLTQRELATRAGLKEKRISTLEDAGLREKRRIELEDFQQLPLGDAMRLADVLQCSVGNISAGLPDDFLSQYVAYYHRFKGSRVRTRRSASTSWLLPPKIVLFDFDGTLTYHPSSLTTWEIIWERLGYHANDCAALHTKFSQGEITHKEWCDLTLNSFKAKGLTVDLINDISDSISLMPGTEEVLRRLQVSGSKVYILSGSIKCIIKRVLGNLKDYFEEIKANDFKWDQRGRLVEIIGTKFDFEGKADFIRQAVHENGIHSHEAFFVGNSSNDTFAHESGARTLCINPAQTNPDHPFHWNHAIKKCSNLNEIFDYFRT